LPTTHKALLALPEAEVIGMFITTQVCVLQ